MNFFSASTPTQPWGAHAAARLATSPAHRPDPAQCGWYDSSFDLRVGLEVVEQLDDELYQLWQLALPR